MSNAADACDKKRFLSLTDDSTTTYEGRVRLIADKARRPDACASSTPFSGAHSPREGA